MDTTTTDAQNLHGQVNDVIGSAIILDQFNIFSFFCDISIINYMRIENWSACILCIIYVKCAQRSEEFDPLGLELQTSVKCHVSAEKN